jgi:hypothetical protein
MKLHRYLLTPALLICSLFASCSHADKRALNSSAMYAPPVLTLKAGTEYKTKEGVITFREEQRFYSAFELARLLLINNLQDSGK